MSDTAETNETGHTPGPWRWEFNLSSKRVSLQGGVPLYDLTVMDFVRYGMNSAAPRFLDAGANCRLMILRRADEFTAIVPGREHHEDWFRGLNHPDANLIAATPDLLNALRALVSHPAVLNALAPRDSLGSLLRVAETAIARAERKS